MDFSLRELECFIAVAEELSFTRAAKRLNLAQPPLSRHIRMLEARLGAKLFNRQPRGVAVTRSGALFYEETKDVAARLARAGDMVRRCELGETQRLRLGFVSAVMNPEMVENLRVFRQEHPDVQVMLEDCSPKDQLRAIAEGKMDGGFVGLEPRGGFPEVEFVPWYDEALVCLLPVGHELAKRRTLALRDLTSEPFVAVSKESAPPYARHWLGLCADAGFSPRVVAESPRAQAVAAMVGAGSGVAILPEALADFVKNAVVAVKIRGVGPITHVFAMKTGNRSSALENFVGLLRPEN